MVSSALSARTRQLCSDHSLERWPIVQNFAAPLGPPGPEVCSLYVTVLKRGTVFSEAWTQFSIPGSKSPRETFMAPFCDTSRYEQAAVKEVAARCLKTSASGKQPTRSYSSCPADLLRRGASSDRRKGGAERILTSHPNKGEKQQVLHDPDAAASPDWPTGSVSC